MFFRRHLSYANVVATMALVFAMGGSAIAAKHYLITSTGQISPKVLKAVEARIAGKVKPGAAGKEGKLGLVGNEGKEGKAGLSLLSGSEQTALKEVLPCIRFVANGVDGKPTIQFSGCNMQIVNGEGKTQTTNGEGNLVIGYDEEQEASCQSGGEPCPRVVRSGSHNLVLGSRQEYTSYGALVGGRENKDSGPDSAVLGFFNRASGEEASVSGGGGNIASGVRSWVGAGNGNNAEGERAAVSGGQQNKSTALDSSVLGGIFNTASGMFSSVGGGDAVTASGEHEFKP
jgi:hypothetical protein